MDSSPVWRRVTFAVIVCVLVALGAYLLGPLAHRQSQQSRQPGAAASPDSSVPPVAASTPPPAAGQPDIYQWLPFTSSGLAAAAAIATRFGTAYGTYSYTRSATAYAASLQPVTSPSLLGQIEAAYAAPGVAAARAGSKQVAAGVATIDAISAFGPTSLTFLVQIAQQITASTGSSRTSTRYSVTLTGNGASWQVTSVELATEGNS
jgi:type IV secretory pathway VirB6-like protein